MVGVNQCHISIVIKTRQKVAAISSSAAMWKRRQRMSKRWQTKGKGRWIFFSLEFQTRRWCHWDWIDRMLLLVECWGTWVYFRAPFFSVMNDLSLDDQATADRNHSNGWTDEQSHNDCSTWRSQESNRFIELDCIATVTMATMVPPLCKCFQWIGIQARSNLTPILSRSNGFEMDSPWFPSLSIRFEPLCNHGNRWQIAAIRFILNRLIDSR